MLMLRESSLLPPLLRSPRLVRPAVNAYNLLRSSFVLAVAPSCCLYLVLLLSEAALLRDAEFSRGK